VWITAAVAASLLILMGALVLAHGDNDTPAPPSFWSLITPVVAEVDPPATVDDIAPRSDAIVVAHISGVRAGRDAKGFFDPTPPVPGAPLPQTTFVDLAVDRVVAGSISPNQTLTLEMLAAPPAPRTLDDVRALIPSGQMLFFLTNNGKRARHDGFASVIEPIEDSLWSLASQKAIVGQGPAGLYEVLDPNELDVPFLQSFAATTVNDAATHTAQRVH